MNEKARIATLIAELSGEVDVLGDLAETNLKADGRVRHGATDELDWAALGYTIHNIYNALESYFLRVSRFFENDVPPSAWHRELVERMTIEIDDLRPRLLDRSLAQEIHELRAFRHVFRNIYGTRLNPDRIRMVQNRVPSTVSAFHAAHARFVAELRAVAEVLE